jgi:hypothetical protein
MSEIIEKLRQQAIYLKLEPKVDIGVELITLLQVLNGVNSSYKSFIETHFINSYGKRKKNYLEKLLKGIFKDFSLKVVDLDYASFGAALAPNTLSFSSDLSNINDILNWKRDTFQQYKDDVFTQDLNDPSFLKSIEKKYNDVERYKIYKPLTSFLGRNKKADYKIKIGDHSKKYDKVLPFVKDESIKILTPKQIVKVNDDAERIFQAYFTTTDELDLFNQKNIKVKRIHAYKELDKPTYPFIVEEIQYENLHFKLNTILECNVEFVDDEYVISYPELDIQVWGDNREVAEDAFCFAFYSLYETFVKAKDSKLTKKALSLKSKLKALIENIKED